MHIGVTSAFMEASRVKEAVIASLTHVSNLSAIYFLYSSGNTTKKLASLDLKDRIADIAYIKFSCYLSGEPIDTRILQPDIDLQFSIKLSQSSWDSNTGIVCPLYSGFKKSSSKKYLFLLERNSHFQERPMMRMIDPSHLQILLSYFPPT